MKEYYVVEIGYSGAGGDVAKRFTLDKDKALWFAKVFFTGLKTLDNESGFIKIIGSDKTLSLTISNNTLPNFKSIKLPLPQCSN
ncbi:hypothetical protein AT00_19785 [Pseudoalteromonas lipolytica SCSIO 04301]|uniref:hypothetical protein n=1 Tax=Pseudoalteromonas lipolytica TaxID=570156 RepID=UPI000451D4F0|nr:hypothetical protein [Pseudoalteromonas lipolytica]EWH04467.1 hypothetical protein AT00_19785 [Pseudoalteromonas lipolytica SCSIO 04301]